MKKQFRPQIAELTVGQVVSFYELHRIVIPFEDGMPVDAFIEEQERFRDTSSSSLPPSIPTMVNNASVFSQVHQKEESNLKELIKSGSITNDHEKTLYQVLGSPDLLVEEAPPITAQAVKRFFEEVRKKAQRNPHLPWNKKLERESANVQNGKDYRE